MFGLDTRELIIIVGILVLLFGAKRIPDLARSIVESVRHIRSGFSDEDKNNKTRKNK